MTSQELELSELRDFGTRIHRSDFSSIAIAAGGFVVSGRRNAIPFVPGEEDCNDGQREQAREKAGPATGPRQRPQAEAAATGAPAHAVERNPALRGLLGELEDYGAKITVVQRSDRFVMLRTSVGLFESLPFRGQLFLDIPLIARTELRRGLPKNGVVPDVRAWSRWLRGPSGAAGPIPSHHAYPDGSMCVCMTAEWHLDRDPILRYMDFCVLWMARSLHDQLIGFYPGPQHYGEKVRVERDRGDEFCGCGRAAPYALCHRGADFAMPWLERVFRHYSARQAYLNELEWQGRSSVQPDRVIVDVPAVS